MENRTSQARTFHEVLRCVALCCVVLRCVALRCVALRCVALRCVALRCVALCCAALRCVEFNRVLLILSHSSKDFAYHGSSNVVGDMTQQSVETSLSHTNNNTKDANEEAPGRDVQEITDGNRLVHLIYTFRRTNRQI